MTPTIFITIVAILTTVFLIYLFVKKIPDLKNLDVDSLPDAKQDDVKAQILESKFSRSSEKARKKMSDFKDAYQGFFSDRFGKIKEKVMELEAHYQNKDGKKDDVKDKPKDIFDRVEELIDQEEYSSAEKELIELIADDKKNVRAYELLGDLYLEMKNYDQAEEVFKYLIKLNLSGGKGDVKSMKSSDVNVAENDVLGLLDVSSKLANYYGDLGWIYGKTEKPEQALDCYLKATSVEPNNPKYLDGLLETSIGLGDKVLARKTLNGLKRINPENAKLDDFRKAIEKL